MSSDELGRRSNRTGEDDFFWRTVWKLLQTRALLGGLAAAVLGFGLIEVSFYLGAVDKSVGTFSVRAVGSGLLVTGVVTAFLYLLVRRYEEQFRDRLTDFIANGLTTRLETIEGRIKKQATALFDGSSSLEALNERGVIRVYATRRDAIGDLRSDLESPGTGRIRLMGVSLNDFVRSDQLEGLHSAWDVITAYAHGTRPLPRGTKSLEIQVLVVDPDCFGARLRSRVETEDPETVSQAGRLESDVEQTAQHLRELAESTKGRNADRVSFAFHVYRLPPTLFVCDAEPFCYAQPYYLWSHRDPAAAMPILKLRPGSDLQRGMQHHFDMIWKYGSIDGCEWLRGHHVGSDRGIHATGVVNVFTDANQARDRILEVLEHAEREISIQGVTLHSFFKAGPLFNHLLNVLHRRNVRVRALLLDPTCPQALQRSYREYALAQRGGVPKKSYRTYSENQELHRNMELFRESRASLDRVKKLMSVAPNFDAHTYDCAPACFMLIVDDHLFIEQYGFGKKVEPDEKRDGVVATLGGDMPLVEYTRTASPLYESDAARSPYDVLQDHFEFVFQYLSHPVPKTITRRDRQTRPGPTSASRPVAARR